MTAIDVLRSFYGFSELHAQELLSEMTDVRSVQNLAEVRVPRTNKFDGCPLRKRRVNRASPLRFGVSRHGITPEAENPTADGRLANGDANKIGPSDLKPDRHL